MNFRIIVLVCSVFLLVGCQPSAEDIERAIAQTQAALPPTSTSTQVPLATNTPRPTATARATSTSTKEPTALPTNTSTPDSVKIIEKVIADLSDLLLNYADVSSITTIRRGELSFEIEAKTKYSSQSNQPDVSFQIIRMLAEIFAPLGEGKALNFVKGDPEHFSISLTTYSEDGDYKYFSQTDFDTLVNLYKKQITYEEWVIESGAGFVE